MERRKVNRGERRTDLCCEVSLRSHGKKGSLDKVKVQQDLAKGWAEFRLLLPVQVGGGETKGSRGDVHCKVTVPKIHVGS